MAAIGNLGARSGARSAALRNLAWLLTDKALAVVFGLFVFGMIARTYGPVGSGHVAYALALLQAALGLSLVCSATPLLPRMCRIGSGIGGMVANVFLVRMGGALLSTLGVALYAVLTISDPQRLTITLIVLLSVPLIEPFYTAVAYWQSRNDNRPPTITRGAGLLTRAALVLVAVTLRMPLWVIGLAWLAESIVSAALQTRSIAHLGSLSALARRITRHRSTTLFRFGVRFFAGVALAGLYVRLDRLFLAEQLPEYEFGLYAAGMQLVDVWLQVGSLIGFAMGPAFLYAAFSAGGPPWRHWRSAMLLASAGITGLLVVLAFGDVALRVVFGRAFDASYPFLVAGVAFGVLLFVDQLVGIMIAVTNQPLVLMIKWGVACVVALAVMWLTFPTLGAFAGPTGLSIGVVVSWIATAAAFKGRLRQTPSRGAPA